MGAVKNGIFFIFLSKILDVDCIAPTNSIQYNEQNSGVANSWTGQSVIPEPSNYYNSISSYSPENTYLNNNNNQPPITYEQQSPVPRPYNEPFQLNPPQQSTTPQQFIPQEQNFLQPMSHSIHHQIQQTNTFQPETPQIPQTNSMLQIQSNAPQSLPQGSFNSNSESVHQQPVNMQYPKFNQNVNTKFKQPYNLYPPLQGGQEASQSFRTIEPFQPKEYQKQLSTSLNPPIPGELPDFGELSDFEVMNNLENQENKPVQVPSKIVPRLSTEASFNSKSNFPGNTLLPPPQTETKLPQFPPLTPLDSNKIPLPQLPSQSPSNPSDKVTSAPYKNIMGIDDGEMLDSPSHLLDGEILPPPQTETKLPQFPPSTPLASIKIPLPQISSQSSSNPSDKVTSAPNKNSMGIDDGEMLDSPSHLLDGEILPPPQTETKLPQFPPSTPLASNKISLPQISSQSSSNPSDKVTSAPNKNTMQDVNETVPLNSILEFLDNKSDPLISNVVGNENILIDNSQTDMQTFLNPGKNDNLNPHNNVSENQDDSQLELNDTSPQLLMDNKQVENVVINNSLQDDFKKDIGLNYNKQKLQNAWDESLLSANVIDTQLNQEPILEKVKAELPVLPFNKKNEENDGFFSLEDLVIDEPLDKELYKYDKSYIVDTENPKNTKQDNAKITVFANPNDVHTGLLISPIQSSTSDNSYPNNNYLLNSPPTDIPWYKPSSPNIVDYVQQPDSYDYNQLLSPLLNVYQNPLFYNQIPMYPSNNNYYDQQDAYSAVGQNQMLSMIQLPVTSLNGKQSGSKDNSGYIYKNVDLRDPPLDTSNSWSLLNKDYTKNSNQNNGYTSYDGKTRTSIFGMPSTSYLNNYQEILNLPSNNMFAQNMMPTILNSLRAPLVSTKAIFDVTRANFPRASLNDVIHLTSAIVESVMLSLQQTLNTIMNNLYGRRSKRDPSESLLNLPGSLIDKYSQQSTTTQKEKNMNIPYYTQLYTTGQQPMLQQQQQQTYYGGPTDMNYLGSQDNNNNIRVVSQTANTQNSILNPLVKAVISAIRSNVPEPYSIDTPEVNNYTHQVIATIKIVFKDQIDNILYGRLPTMNI